MPSAAAARSTGLMLMGRNFTTESMTRASFIGASGLPGASTSCLPAPAEGLVDGNQAGGGLGSAAGQPILGFQQGPLGVQHLQEIAGAVFITYPGQAGGGLAGLDRGLVMHQPVARAGMRDQ